MSCDHVYRPPEPLIVEHVKAIRELCKKTIADVMEIGRRLIECKTLVGHSKFGNFLNREFGWSERTAQRFMSVHELAEAKSDNLADLDLPISSLYLLAAPSTPIEVRDEILDRAAKGEKIKYADVKAAVAPSADHNLEHKGHQPATAQKPAENTWRARGRAKEGTSGPASERCKAAPENLSEVQRKLARLDELEKTHRAQDIKLKGYESDIEELRALSAAAEPKPTTLIAAIDHAMELAGLPMSWPSFGEAEASRREKLLNEIRCLLIDLRELAQPAQVADTAAKPLAQADTLTPANEMQQDEDPFYIPEFCRRDRTEQTSPEYEPANGNRAGQDVRQHEGETINDVR